MMSKFGLEGVAYSYLLATVNQSEDCFIPKDKALEGDLFSRSPGKGLSLTSLVVHYCRSLSWFP